MAFLFYISKKLTAGGCASPNSTGSATSHSPAFDFAGGHKEIHRLYGECGIPEATGFDFLGRDAGVIPLTGREIHKSSRLYNFAGAEVIPLTGSAVTEAPAFYFWGGRGVNSTGSENRLLTPCFLPAETGVPTLRGVKQPTAGYYEFYRAGYGRKHLYGEDAFSLIKYPAVNFVGGGYRGRLSLTGRKTTLPPPIIYKKE